VEAGQGGKKGERYDSVVSVSVPYRGGAGCSADAEDVLRGRVMTRRGV
jgi:hypothetical protein